MKINTNGIEINYELEGHGPLVTLSHSLACNLSMWNDQMEALTRHYTVLRFDTRGHGESSAPPGEFTLEQLADDAKALFDAINATQTHWIGLSMGGMIGQTFALKYPGMIRSMVLADTASELPSGADKIWSERARVAREQGMEPLVGIILERWFTEPYCIRHEDVMTRIGNDIRHTPAAGYIGCCSAISGINLTKRLNEITCPVLVLVGECDLGTPVPTAQAIHRALPGSELRIIPKAAHLSNIEQRDVFNEAVVEFLDSHFKRK